MDISFDPPTRAETLTERGLDFADAGLVFQGKTATIEASGYSELRYITAGYLNDRCVVIVWTPRDGARRIISMRHAHAGEEAKRVGHLR